MVLHHDLSVDLSTWRDAIDAGNQLATTWWNTLVVGAVQLRGTVATISLLVLLGRAAASAAALSFFRQLVWQLARLTETSLLKSLSGGIQHQDSISARVRDLADVLDRPDLLDHQLLRYVMSGVEQTRGAVHLSFCHDKGNASGLQLQPSVFFLKNIGIVACPMVPVRNETLPPHNPFLEAGQTWSGSRDFFL